MSRAIPLLPLWTFGTCYRVNVTFILRADEAVGPSDAIFLHGFSFLISGYITSLEKIEAWRQMYEYK
jgi:hypothetical protein